MTAPIIPKGAGHHTGTSVAGLQMTVKGMSGVPYFSYFRSQAGCTTAGFMES